MQASGYRDMQWSIPPEEEQALREAQSEYRLNVIRFPKDSPLILAQASYRRDLLKWYPAQMNGEDSMESPGNKADKSCR